MYKMWKNTEVMIYPKNWRGRKQTRLNIKNWCIQVTEIRNSLYSFHFLSRFEILQHNFFGKYFKVRKKKEFMVHRPGVNVCCPRRPRAAKSKATSVSGSTVPRTVLGTSRQKVIWSMDDGYRDEILAPTRPWCGLQQASPWASAKQV